MAKEEHKPHWMTMELKSEAQKQGKGPGDLEKLILEQSGVRLSQHTIKYWFYGKSDPTLGAADLIANALGMELDLMQKELKVIPSQNLPIRDQVVKTS